MIRNTFGFIMQECAVRLLHYFDTIETCTKGIQSALFAVKRDITEAHAHKKFVWIEIIVEQFDFLQCLLILHMKHCTNNYTNLSQLPISEKCLYIYIYIYIYMYI